MSGRDGILWVGLILAAIVVGTLYRQVLTSMLFDPGYTAATSGGLAPGSTQNPNGTVNPPAGTGPIAIDPNTGRIGTPGGGSPPGYGPFVPGSIGGIIAPGLR